MTRRARVARLALAVLAVATAACSASPLTTPERLCDPRDWRDRDLTAALGTEDAPVLPGCQPTSR